MADISALSTNIHKLSTVLGRVADGTLQEKCGFGISQFKILWILHNHPEGVLQTTIATWLSQTEAAVSRQVNLLKKDGLVRQEVDAENRRNHIIKLTNSGEKLANNAMKALTVAYKPCFEVLSGAEQEKLTAMLEKVFFSVIAKHLEK